MYIGVILFSILFVASLACIAVIIIVIIRNELDITFDDGAGVLSIAVCLVILLISAGTIIRYFGNIEKSKNAAQLYNKENQLSLTTEDVFYNKELIEKLFINKGEEE